MSGKPMPRSYINGFDQTRKLLNHCIKIAFDERADTFAIQLIAMMHETNVDAERKDDNKKFLKMAADAKEYILRSTDKLAVLACEKEGLPVKDFVREIYNFYKILPDDLFMGKPTEYEGYDSADEYYDELEESE